MLLLSGTTLRGSQSTGARASRSPLRPLLATPQLLTRDRSPSLLCLAKAGEQGGKQGGAGSGGSLADQLARLTNRTPPLKAPELEVEVTAPESAPSPASPRRVYSTAGRQRQWQASNLAGRDNEAAKQLTNEIKACQAPGALLDLVSKQIGLAALGDIGLSAAFKQLSVLRVSSGELRGDARFQQMVALSLERMPLLSARVLANIMHACSTMQLRLSDEWMAAFWRESELKLAEFTPQNLANTLTACSKLEQPPPAGWMVAFWRESEAKLAPFNPQNLANTLTACSKLEQPPPAGWMVAFWRESELKLAEFNPQDLANTLTACSKLQQPPPDEWLAAFWRESEAKLSEFTPQNLANTLTACSKLEQPPPAGWMVAFWRESEAKLAHFNPQELANTLTASALSCSSHPHSIWQTH
jgi:hypothetical protein